MKQAKGKVRNKDEQAAGRRATIAGLGVNLALVALKFTLGVLGQSQALVADAVHSVSDLFTDGVVIFGLAAGGKQADDNHHFGHGRMETLAAAFVSLALAGVGIYIAWQAAQNIYRHNTCHPTWLALTGAAISIAAKEGLFWYTIGVGKKIRSKAVVANAWHHRSDALSSVAVFVGVAGAQINPAWSVLDSWAALVVAALVLRMGLVMFGEAMAEFTDQAPDPEVMHAIGRCVSSVPGVLGMHDLKVRTSADMIQMQLHIVVDGALSVTQGHHIAKEVEACLFRDMPNLMDVVIHVDPG